jgi:hypothetical protein
VGGSQFPGSLVPADRPSSHSGIFFSPRGFLDRPFGWVSAHSHEYKKKNRYFRYLSGRKLTVSRMSLSSPSNLAIYFRRG